MLRLNEMLSLIFWFLLRVFGWMDILFIVIESKRKVLWGKMMSLVFYIFSFGRIVRYLSGVFFVLLL